MKIKWSSPDHVSAIEINLGENDKFVANFHVFWFLLGSFAILARAKF